MPKEVSEPLKFYTLGYGSVWIISVAYEVQYDKVEFWWFCFEKDANEFYRQVVEMIKENKR